MADTKPTSFKIRAPRWILLSLLAVIATLVVVTMPKPAPPEFRRYVGPPLPDGSRVTFLYPASANQIVSTNTPPPGPIIQDVQMVKPPEPLQAILGLLPSWRRAHPTNDLTIGALVRKVPARVPVINGRAVTRKRIQQTIKSQKDIYIESVVDTNAKTRTECDFNYSYLASSAPSPAFVKREATITNSFQVLPPGVAVPAP